MSTIASYLLRPDRPWSTALNCLTPIDLSSGTKEPVHLGTPSPRLSRPLPVHVKLRPEHWKPVVTRSQRGRYQRIAPKAYSVVTLSGGDVGSNWASVDRDQLHTELKAQNFDKIRFATYRTACKLRFIQKKVYFHLVDIYNVIEAFRENNLHGDALGADTEVSVGKLESTLSTVYYYLNKRLPSTHQLNVEQALSVLLGWIMECTGSIKVISIKVALSTLCSGKYVDKLKYVFENLVSDHSSGGQDGSGSGSCLNLNKFDAYLKQVLAMPTIVHEGPSFGYEPNASLKACFPHFSSNSKIKVNDYLDTMFADPGPQCLLWLPLMHRMSNVENVLHPISCSFCSCESMMGFRYKCQRCPNYQLCQNCFWYGQANGQHSNDHEMKEYSTYKSPAKQFTHTLRKGTLKCLPSTNRKGCVNGMGGPEDMSGPDGKASYALDTIDGPSVNLQHIIPPQPVTSSEYPMSSPSTGTASSAHPLSPIRDPTLLAHYDRLTEALENSNNKMDEEHRLIARYAAKLAQETLNALSGRPGTTVNSSLHASTMEMNKNQKQREILADLHQKNRDIMREIARLKEERDETSRMTSLAAAAGGIHPMAASGHLLQGARTNNPSLMQELRSLRQRKEELEQRMACLQESRRELMVQLESLMKMLRTNQNVVPISTPSQTLANFSSNSNTTGSSPNNSGHYNQQKLMSANQSAYLGQQTVDQSQTMTSAMYPPHSSAVSMATMPRTMTGMSAGVAPGSGPGQQQQLHQELLISAENASHAAIDLLSKLSLGIAPDMDPSAINTFAYYPYAGQQSAAGVGGGGKTDLISATTIAHHQMFPNNNQLQPGAINNPPSQFSMSTTASLPQHSMPSYLGASSTGAAGGGIMTAATGPINQSGASIYSPHSAGGGPQQVAMAPPPNLGNICT